MKHILFASLLMTSMAAAAQETYQDAKLTAPQLTGTARYVGMGKVRILGHESIILKVEKV